MTTGTLDAPAQEERVTGSGRPWMPVTIVHDGLKLVLPGFTDPDWLSAVGAIPAERDRLDAYGTLLFDRCVVAVQEESGCTIVEACAVVAYFGRMIERALRTGNQHFEMGERSLVRHHRVIIPFMPDHRQAAPGSAHWMMQLLWLAGRGTITHSQRGPGPKACTFEVETDLKVFAPFGMQTATVATS